MLPDLVSTWPDRLLSFWAPWWWFICHHSKRVENRGQPYNFRGAFWIHASLNSDKNLMDVVRDTIAAIPLPRGRNPPTEDILAANAGHIVGMARIVGCELNTPRVCLGDRWAIEGSYGIKLEAVEALPVSIPWKGAQGLVKVDPMDVAIVKTITEQGGVLVPSSRDSMRDLVALYVRNGEDAAHVIREHLPARLAGLVAHGQLRLEGGRYFVRDYSARLSTEFKKKPPTPPDAPPAPDAPAQGSFGW